MLADKVTQLETDVVTARRITEFWRKQIGVHGERKAEAFYLSVGLNHLETKSIEWEGLTLFREPSDLEKLCIKSISQAQDAGKASVTVILLEARSELIDDGLKAIRKLTPATYHELILTMPDEFHSELRGQLEKVFHKGQSLVAAELAQQKGKARTSLKQSEEDNQELDDLTDLTDSRLANDIQARITAAAARFALVGLTGAALWDAVSKEVSDGSTGWLDRIAAGAASKALSDGRLAEMEDRKDEIDHYEQSEILDQNTCGPCAEDDGKTASDPDDLPGAPNPDCEGGDYCRAFVAAITL